MANIGDTKNCEEMFQVDTERHLFTFFSDGRYNAWDEQTNLMGGNRWKIVNGKMFIEKFQDPAFMKEVQEKYEAYLAEKLLE